MIKRKIRNSNCQQCRLWESASTVCMMGSGPANPRLMIVLEAPSNRADEGGPLIGGPAGKLFLGMLAEFGIDEPYVTHAAKCRPSDGDSPSVADLKACKPYLEAEIEKYKPEFIVTLGAPAFKAFSKGKITELHGNVIDMTLGGHSFKLYPTFHPAIALRDPSKLAPLRQDIGRLAKVMGGEAVGQEEIHWEVIRTMDQWNDFIDEYRESPAVAIDTETTGLDRNVPEFEINSIQVSLVSGRNFAIPLNVRDSRWGRKNQEIFIETLVELADGKIVIMQNGKFDNLNLRKKYGIQFKLTFDTMLAHHLLDENSPHGLDSMAMVYLDAPNWDIDLKTKLGLGDLTKFYRYSCYDTYYTLKLYKIFRAKLLKLPGLRRLFYKLVMPIARVFEDIEFEGLFVNQERIDEVFNHLMEKDEIVLKELKTYGNINWNSPKQVGELFFEKLGIPIVELTPSGAYSTGESALLQIDHPAADKLMEYRGIEKNLSTYILGWQGKKIKVDKKTGERSIIDTDEKHIHNDRLFLSTKLHGTVTGRFASRLHQVPRDPLIRSIIDAPEGWELVVADYSQIELRLAAHASNDSRMKMVFQTGGDIHATTASEVLGTPPEKLTKEERKKGKPINFGFLYGMGAPKFKIYARDNYGVKFSDAESKGYRVRYFELFNALPKWHERMRRTVRMYGQVESLSGRVRHLPGINSSDQGVRAEAERQAINSPIQGFGSGDLKAMAMLEVRETFDWETELRLLGEVHDSIIMIIPVGTRDIILPRVKEIMEAPSLFKDFDIRLTVPLLADFEVGPWGKGEKWEP